MTLTTPPPGFQLADLVDPDADLLDMAPLPSDHLSTAGQRLRAAQDAYSAALASGASPARLEELRRAEDAAWHAVHHPAQPAPRPRTFSEGLPAPPAAVALAPPDPTRWEPAPIPAPQPKPERSPPMPPPAIPAIVAPAVARDDRDPPPAAPADTRVALPRAVGNHAWTEAEDQAITAFVAALPPGPAPRGAWPDLAARLGLPVSAVRYRADRLRSLAAEGFTTIYHDAAAVGLSTPVAPDPPADPAPAEGGGTPALPADPPAPVSAPLALPFTLPAPLTRPAHAAYLRLDTDEGPVDLAAPSWRALKAAIAELRE